MMGRTHSAVGAACAAAVVFFVPAVLPIPDLRLAAVAVALGGLGGLLPDVDHPKSRFGRTLGPISWALHRAFGHRTIFHTLLCWMALSAAAWHWLPSCVAVPLSVGYVSHLLADSVSYATFRTEQDELVEGRGGAPLLWPLLPIHERTGVKVFVLGGLGEHLVAAAATCTTGALAYLRITGIA